MTGDAESLGGKSKSTLGMHSTESAASRSRRRKKSKMMNWPTLIRETFTNLFDLVGDWAYFYSVYSRHYVDGDLDVEGKNLFLDIEDIISVLLGFCVMSTFLSSWTFQTTVFTFCGRKSMCCNCTVPRLALLGILIEDLPQFLLAAYIDINVVGTLTPAAVLTICSSLSALVVRMTSRYEEVRDEDDDKLQPIVEFAL
ncbi:hypothetical protein ACHAXM_007847 [Skeletonema potamos]|jgi:hypothetical protein